MKKASKIIFTILGILNIVSAVNYFIFGIVALILWFTKLIPLPEALLEEFAKALMNAGVNTDPETVYSVMAMVICIYLAVICFLSGILYIVLAILSFKGAKAEKKGILIANIVVGVLAEGWLNIVAAILGLIGLAKEKKVKEEDKVAAILEDEPKPKKAPAKKK